MTSVVNPKYKFPVVTVNGVAHDLSTTQVPQPYNFAGSPHASPKLIASVTKQLNDFNSLIAAGEPEVAFWYLTNETGGLDAAHAYVFTLSQGHDLGNYAGGLQLPINQFAAQGAPVPPAVLAEIFVKAGITSGVPKPAPTGTLSPVFGGNKKT